MRVPLTWLAEHVRPEGDFAAGDGGWDLDRLVDRLVMTGTEIEAVHSIGSETDTVLELEVTPNRPDCLGIYGVAREAHAVTGCPLGPEPWLEDAEPAGGDRVEDLAAVRVDVPVLCPRFTARAFTGVEVGPSPAWLEARLAAAGQRPVNNVVDITNYAMLLTGQPLHAFDLDRVEGESLTVRGASTGESLRTLDGELRELGKGTVVVCDEGGPAAIAGIMGGMASEVGEETTRVLLEVACWDGPDILASSRRLALRTEASARFEKQLHPELCERAQRIASRLLVEICGARMAAGTIDVDAGRPELPEVELRTERAGQLLGMPIAGEDQAAYLERLGFEVRRGSAPDRLAVTVPADRHADVSREADLIEEVGRVHGLWSLPATLPSVSAGSEIPVGSEATGGAGGSASGAVAGAGGLTRAQALRRRAEDTLCTLGFDEVVGWSFTDPGELDRLRLHGEWDGDPAGPAVRLANPLSEEQAIMRTTLLGSLLDVAARNASRGAGRIALFESGRVYEAAARPAGEEREGGGEVHAGSGAMRGHFPGTTHDPPARETHRLAALAIGPIRPAGWDGSAPGSGFFALKGVLEALAARLGASFAFTATDLPFLHPGRAASVAIAAAAGEAAGGEALGWIGELHPDVASAWDLEGAVAFELDLAPLIECAAAGEETFEDVTSFPAVFQDLAVVVPEEVAASRVRDTILAAAPLLRGAEVFDLYRGDQVGEGSKSLALQLEFRAPDRTLTDAEVADSRERIAARIGEELGGSIRG